MSPNDYNERFYHLVRRESFYAKRLSAMNEEICEAFLNISRFLIDEGYVSNAREVDNIVEALPEQALANMFDDETFATKFKIALKAVNPRLSENALSGEKRQAAAIALRLLEYSKNNATYLRPGCKAPEKDADGPAGEYNPRGRKKRPAGGSGAIDASLKGDVTQTTEEIEIEERYKGKHGQSSDEYKRDRSPAGKMVSGDDKQSGAEYTHGRRVKAENPGSQPDEGGKTRPKSQGKMDAGSREDLKYRKVNLARKHRIAKIAKEETEVEEGYKPIEKKKEAAMYRRAGNLARTSLSSKGKKKEEAQTKSAKIVSAISSQKERERFAKMGDEKARDNYKEEVQQIDEISAQLAHTASMKADEVARKARISGDKETAAKKVAQASRLYKGVGPRRVKERMAKEEVEIHEEEGKKDACYKKVKARYSVWPSAYASGALVKCRKKGAANWGNKSEEFDIDALLNDPIFDQITEEELLHFAFDIFEEMEEEGVLSEAVEYFDDVLLEDRYASAVAGSKANARAQRKARVMGAMKTAAGAVKSAGSAAAGRAAEMAKKAAPAARKAAGTAAKAVGAAARGGASLAKRAAVKGAAAAGEVAGAAKGGYEAGRIKAKREAMAKTKPQAKSSSDDGTKGKLDSLLKDVRGGDKKPASSSGSSGGGSSSSGGGSSDSGTQTRKRGLLRRVGSAIKSTLKKAVGKTARGVSNVAGAAATRLGEDTEFDIVLDYLLEYDVCSLEEAEEVMMELTDEEITNILDENRAAARAAGGYKDDSKKQTDPSKDGFTGISNSIKDIMRQNREIEARNKKK